MAEGSELNQESRAKWPTCPDDYELQEVIGRGATAIVQAATIKKTNERVAVKRINLDRCNTSLEDLLKEIQVMSQCQHDNVVRFYTSFVVQEELWLIMKLLDGGSLLDVIRYTMQRGNCRNGVFDEIAIATVLREVIKGIDYFHSNGHIHRDIKAGNILLGADGSVKIADFGVSAFIASGGDNTRDKQRHTFVGTPCWMAPEVVGQQPTGYDTKADIWSFGILAIELATGTAPYHKYPPMKILIMIIQNESPTLDMCAEDPDQYKQYSKTFNKMIEQCLQKNPTDRPTAKQLLKHDFFKKAKDHSYIAKHLVLKFQERKAMEEKLANRRKLTHMRSIRVIDDEEWTFSSGSDDDSSSANEDSTNPKLPPLENPTVQNIEELIGKPDAVAKPNPPVDDSTSQLTVQEMTSGIKDLSIDNNRIFKFTLRIRNTQGELNDIKFEFNKSNETVKDVVSEMVSANLIHKLDADLVTSIMSQMVENSTDISTTFALKSHVDSSSTPDDKLLIGFAQLSLNI
ncbi:unnamed protein product [Rotaria socialis]